MWAIQVVSLTLLMTNLPASAAAARATPACPPLSVTVDGRPVALVKGMGASVREGKSEGLLISRFNHSRMGCPAYLDPIHDRTPDELVISAYVGKLTNVRANGTNGVGAKATVITAPKKIGDTVAICVPQAVQHAAEWNGRTVTVRIQGLISGIYCGRQE